MKAMQSHLKGEAEAANALLALEGTPRGEPPAMPSLSGERAAPSELHPSSSASSAMRVTAQASRRGRNSSSGRCLGALHGRHAENRKM
jgi:hypothetical protein